MSLPEAALTSEASPKRSARSNFEKARRKVSGIAALLFAFVMLLNGPPASRPIVNEILEVTGMTLLAIAALGRLWTSAYLGGRKTKVLCTAGPFSVCRNPLYFFSLLAAIGIGMLSESFVLTTGVAVVFLAYYQFIIRDEEKRLREAFGTPYEEYCRRVPPFFPRFSEYRDEPVIELHTRPFRRAFAGTSWFLWIFLLFEFFEVVEMAVGHRVLPVLWTLY